MRVKFDRSHIQEITINAADNTVSVTLMAPLWEENGEGYDADSLTVEEVITLHECSRTSALPAAVKNLVSFILTELNANSSKSPEKIRCDTCVGNCCTDYYSRVSVTRSDTDRLHQVADLNNIVWNHGTHDGYDNEEDWTGSVGSLARKKMKVNGKEREVCVFLKKDGCSVYEHRPDVCRQYSAYDCGDAYEADPKKVAKKAKGKVTLRVVS